MLAGAHTDDDFATSIKAYLHVNRCFPFRGGCGRRFAVLEVASHEPYPDAPGLARAKMKRFEIVRCPNCGTSIGSVIRIMEEVV